MQGPGAAPSRSDAVAALLDDLGDVPAIARDRYLAVVAANPRAQALSPAFRLGRNLARYAFLDPGPTRFADDVRATLAAVVAVLRDSVEEHEDDDRFRALVGELAARSPAFAELWAEEPAAPAHRGVLTCVDGGAERRALGYREVRIVDDTDFTVVILHPDAERVE